MIWMVEYLNHPFLLGNKTSLKINQKHVYLFWTKDEFNKKELGLVYMCKERYG